MSKSASPVQNQRVSFKLPPLYTSASGRGLVPAYPSAGRQDSRSTTPAVIVDLGIGRPVYTTVHCRRPSVSRRRGTNMEQFAS